MPTLSTDRRIAVDLEETSDVAALPDGGFVVVSDLDARAAIVGADGRTAHLALPGLEDGASALESVAYDAAQGLLHVFAEERGELLTHRWDGRAGSSATLAGRRSIRFGKKKNKGVEGIALHRGRLLCANEDKPQGLFLIAASGDDEPVEVELDGAILDACADFSGLAEDPRRGTWLVVSDESASLVEIAIDDGDAPRARSIGAWDLVDERGKALKRVEGVAVDRDGAWWVLLENERTLCRVGPPASPR